ncbi:MAG: aminotransferase class III-fold pyridoxal phosphate-dependent enzyme [Gemmatimonadetes bacterium]|nr:aminotransferase class III-fold pyridoxal phosphate-dependent enzyme [Gemmatimonadota bacterium]NNM07163.1 aminotransferase class III-fold pyridoxal phosphate-dependent enzyme [Gemmatimonadota bacterium]
MNVIEQLAFIRTAGGTRVTVGLPDETLDRFASVDPTLLRAIEAAVGQFELLKSEFPDFMALDELDQVAEIQSGIVNFYAHDAVNPYVALAARGPWIVTTKGAVVHDNGGYGMLGFGHVPADVIEAMSRPQVMANVMTSNLSQYRLVKALEKEIGRTRPGGCPFTHFLAMNSGSESVSVGSRIADINAKEMTDPGGRHEGKPVKKLSLVGGFHGRTGRPAQFSDSCRGSYQNHLASFRHREDLITVEPNDVDALQAAFAKADADGFFIEAFFMEPVMGEGDPGLAVTPEFYCAARELTEAHGSVLLMDSIQAGLRATGHLSVVDYPGFGELAAPDLETYSKALNAGQYPLSILAMNDRAAKLYRTGVYGNTMTANPRAMDVGFAVLQMVTDEVRENIVARGHEFLEKLRALAEELGGPITKVQGTGLLFSCELDPSYKAYGAGSLEEYMRLHGVGVIHGGENSLRFTPHFEVTSAEVDLIVDHLRDALINGPKRADA